MYIRYPDQCAPTNVGSGSTSYSNLGDMPNIFLEWNAADLVSEYEIQRNNILEQLQGNRNPFIDNPHIATIIWNGPAATDTWNILSIQSIKSESIVLYPTITTGVIFIKSIESTPLIFSVYNSSGQQIKKGNTVNQIDISNEQSGIYFVKILNNISTSNHSIIKR